MLGASYIQFAPHPAQCGFAYDPTPVPNQFRTARLPDADRYWLTAGLAYVWTPDLRFDAAHLDVFGRHAPINEVSQTGDLLASRYSDHIDIVSLSASFRFDDHY